jgi:1-acyl-sn-glycerol-3-phosphate acyltransferase
VVFLLASPFIILFGYLSKWSHPLYNIYSFFLVKGINIYLWLSPIRWKIKDFESLNQLRNEKVLIISNHRSHLDMFLFLSVIPRLRAIANHSIFRVPILGFVMRLSKMFSLEKGNPANFQNVLNDVRAAIQSRDRVLVFPEMTRCITGFQGIQKFRLFIFQLAREEDVRILPIVLADTDKIWQKGKAEMDFSHHISLKTLPPVRPNDFASSTELSKHLHKIMESSYMELTS